MRALDKMNEFLGFITQTYFPEFHTFPVLAKMGHLDLAYTAGASGSRNGYKRFAAAIGKKPASNSVTAEKAIASILCRPGTTGRRSRNPISSATPTAGSPSVGC